MVEDTPNWEVFVGAYEGLYRNHPVRVSIPGSEESISHITPELLYTCHRAFYSPKNMALVVCAQRTLSRYAAWQRRFHRRTHPRSVSVITESAARKSISRL